MNRILTVLLITYNHAPYFRKAIESVLEQETKYPFIIHVFDDASTDGTSDIVREYAKKYPDKVIPFIAKENQGAQANIWSAYKSVKTKYFAVLESDDFWCCKNKLEMQIEALENHPECSFCAGNTKIISIGDKLRFIEDGTKMVTNKYFCEDKICSDTDIMRLNDGYMNHISTRVLRTSSVELDKIKEKEAILYDNSQYYYMLSKGKMYYFNKVFSSYVQTGKGSFSSQDMTMRMTGHIEKLMDLNKELNYKYSHLVFMDMRNFLNYYYTIHKKLSSPPPKKDLEFSEKYSIEVIISRLQRIKRYFLPRFLIDIIDIPFNIIKYVSRKIRNSKGEI